MKQRLLIVSSSVVAAGLILALLLPSLISALPGEVRGRLPEELIRAVTTPLPTALPAPLQASEATPLPVSDLVAAIERATTTPTSAPTESAAAVSPTSTPPPTATEIPATQISRQAGTAARVLPEPVEEDPFENPPPTLTATPTHTPQPTQPPVRPVRYPQRVRITGLTIVPQKFNNCGSANMSVMLGYYGAAHSQQEIAARIKPHYDDRNVTPEELVAYVNEETALQAAVFRGGDIDLLRTLIQAGFPVIIEKGYEPDAWQGWMGHYLTLIGYDDEEAAFTSLDTYLGPWDSSGRAIAYEELAQRWAQFNHAFLVVYRPFEAETIAGLLGPQYTESALMWQNAAAAAETAVAQDAGDAFQWFNLGMSLNELGELKEQPSLFEAAAAAFDQARLAGLPPRMLWYQFQPYTAYINSGRIDEALALAEAVMSSEGGAHVEESHYYQGAAYQAAGRGDLARTAYQRALEIRPGYAEAEAALQGLAN